MVSPAARNAFSSAMKINQFAKGEHRRIPVAGLALLLYLTLSLIYFGLGDLSHSYLGTGTDPYAYIWFLNWWPWALAHGVNPFVSHYVWYPHGVNMTWTGSMPTAALLLWPVTWASSAAVSYNVLCLIAPALSAWTAFLLIRYLTGNGFASLIGGYLFGFSSYELGQMLGQPSNSVNFVLPLLVLLVIKRIRGELSRTHFVAVLAIALLAQLGLSTELLATVCLFGALALAVFLLFGRSEERRTLWVTGWEIVLSATVMAVVASPFLFFIFNGLGYIPRQFNSPEIYSADLLNYLIPTKMIRLGRNVFGGVAERFTGNIFEQGAYLCLPLILILVLQLRDIRRRPYVKPLLVIMLAIILLSLGPKLQVAGFATNVWLPWSLGLYLPLIHQALPTRFPMYAWLIAAVITGFWLSQAGDRRHQMIRFALAGLACLCLVPNLAMVTWTPLPLVDFFEPNHVVAALGRDANVIVLPFSENGPCMIWQWQADMRFTQSGGFVGTAYPAEFLSPVVSTFYSGQPRPSFEKDISSYCVDHHVSAILVGPDTSAPLVEALHALHWPEMEDRGILVVRVPDQLLHPH
jgi:hypothetical protein